MRKLVIGSRASKLALLQTELVVAKMREINPDVEVSIREIVTRGDSDKRTRLDRMPSVGVFVKELEEALLAGRIDLAVHSLKDMSTEIPQGLSLAAITKREDPRDVLVAKAGGLSEQAPGAKIGTGSLRRAVQLARYRPDLEVCSIRGNVDTRLGKVTSGEVDGVILAAAAMIRMGWANKISQYLPPEHFLPAAGQGALALEARIDDDEVAELMAFLNHLPTRQSVTAERAFLKGLGGGCRAAIAALGTVNGATLKLEGMVADAESKKVLSAWEEGSSATAEEIGARLAEKLLAMGASEFVTELKLE
ncbi:MAG: hydroxymethylbilane synthase [Dehalococcoidales bacterium]|nr:hydroxymethylbilane synthase [Dehalococcoidales bacterium]